MKTCRLVFVLVLMAALRVEAAPLNITSIIGGWQNAVGGAGTVVIANAAAQGTDRIEWGGVVPASGYEFTPSADIIGVPVALPFQLGLFTHINNVIPVDSAISSVQYSFGFSTNGAPAALADTFLFTHDETPNSLPCPPGSVSICDDVVNISSVSLNQLITVGADTYFFNLLGFSTDGGATIRTQYLSPEEGSNRAGLYGVITREPIPSVPEPGTLTLLGGGLVSWVAARRRRSRRR